jgi:hypothetical protein
VTLRHLFLKALQMNNTPPQTQRRHWTGAMVWDGKTIAAQDNWIIQLQDHELREIRTAVEESQSSGKPVGNLSRSDFKLTDFGNRLLKLRDDVLNGRGYAVLRGLPGDQWSDEELIRAYWGIGTWLGDPVSQNAKAHLLGHVIDQRSAPSAGTRIYQTNQAQPFHSDSCDIVGLLCLRPAKHGGASSIASSPAIYNALLDTNPAALDALCGVFLCDRYGEIPAGKLAYYAVRVFNDIDSKPVCCGMDPDIRSAQRLEGVAPLSQHQLVALDAFQQTARALALNMTLERGDIQIVNNHTVVHAREQFNDYPEREKRRYLIRLWLSSPHGRRLPEFMAERWGNIEPGSVRGGIKVPGATPVVYLDPSH